jgi:hypothetical protein
MVCFANGPDYYLFTIQFVPYPQYSKGMTYFATKRQGAKTTVVQGINTKLQIRNSKLPFSQMLCFANELTFDFELLTLNF